MAERADVCGYVGAVGRGSAQHACVHDGRRQDPDRPAGPHAPAGARCGDLERGRADGDLHHLQLVPHRRGGSDLDHHPVWPRHAQPEDVRARSRAQPMPAVHARPDLHGRRVPGARLLEGPGEDRRRLRHLSGDRRAHLLHGRPWPLAAGWAGGVPGPGRLPGEDQRLPDRTRRDRGRHPGAARREGRTG